MSAANDLPGELDATAAESQPVVNSGTGTRKTRRVPHFQIGTELIAWGLVVAAAWVLSWLTPHALWLWGSRPSPLRANTLLLACAVVAVVLLVIAYGKVSGLQTDQKVRWQLLLIGPIVVCAGSAAAALHPGAGSILGRDRVEQAAGPVLARIVAIPVLFPKGRDELLGPERKRLIEIVRMFVGCAMTEPQIRGFASSACYPTDCKGNNKSLANRRAARVAKELEQAGLKSVPVQWDQWEEMATERRLRDVDLDGRPIAQVERLNQRAEVLFDQASCFVTKDRGRSSAAQP